MARIPACLQAAAQCVCNKFICGKSSRDKFIQGVFVHENVFDGNCIHGRSLLLGVSIISICGLLIGVFWITCLRHFFWSTRSVFVVWPSLLCGIAYVSKLIRQKWESCTLPECQPRASRQVSWQPDHILLTSFRKNVHPHREQLRSDRRQTQNYLPWSLTALL